MPFSFIYLFAYDAQHAKDMYDTAKCSECHDSSHYTSQDRKVQNYKQLHKQVDACRYSTNADWFDEDRDDVVKYLNDKYYEF
jgi:hypothetical protein